MKIIHTSFQYWYGQKDKGLDYIVEDGFNQSFKKLGNELYSFYFDDYTKNEYDEELQKKIINFAEKIQPDLIFFSMYTNQFTVETLTYLKSKYKTIAWFGDDQWRFDNYTKNYANYFTYCITTDKFSINKYKALGQENIILSQWAAIDSQAIPEFSGNYKYDVSFIGQKNPHREWFVNTLKTRGITVETFGDGWANGLISAEQMNYTFRHSKINLNLSNSQCFDGRFFLLEIKNHLKNNLYRKNIFHSIKSFLQLKSFFHCLTNSQKNQSQIKARNFEIPFFAGFEITEYVPTIGDYFIIDQEIICYKDIDEAEKIIKYYLENDEEREIIRKAGHKRALANHGYYNRLEKILNIL